MDAVLKKPVFKLAAAAILSLLLPFYLSTAAMSAADNETKITRTVPLGSTKDDVLRIMGKPNSPLDFDFSYKRGSCEILVTFSNKTNLVDAVIVIGKNPEYSIEGITVGSPKSEVKKMFGDPEKKHAYKKGGTECWLYPSEKVNFCIKEDKVASFSVSDTRY
jgi:outer membrane protein assembly factor BamE (lipoprotein component of BamABCDE complex)